MKEVVCYFDFASPYAYLGATQIERVAAAHGARVSWRPILVGALFKTVGTANVPLLDAPEPKRRYLLRDLFDWAGYWQVPFVWPTRFPMRTVLPLRLTLAVDEAQRPALLQAIFRAYWAEDRDISDPAVLAGLDGVQPAALARAADDPELKAALRANTDTALQAGCCGVPSFVVDGYLFWGQDRLTLVERVLDGWRPPL